MHPPPWWRWSNEGSTTSSSRRTRESLSASSGSWISPRRRSATHSLVRRSVQRARSLDELRQAASVLPSTVLELAEMGTPALRVSGLLSAVRDLVVQRAVELTPTSVSTTDVSWLVLGSSARREALPGSDVDTALAWPGPLSSQRGTAPGRCRPGADGPGAVRPSQVSGRCQRDRTALQPFGGGVGGDHPPVDPASGVGERPAARLDRGGQPARDHVELGRALTESMLASARDRRFLSGLLSFTLAVKPPRWAPP